MIRPARTDDAPAIAAIWNPIIRDSMITFAWDEKTADEIRAAITARGPAYLIAETAGRVTGFATYGAFRSGAGYAHVAEHTVHLAPSARGKGQGRALYTALETHARNCGLHALIAEISATNLGGLAFHTALGFDTVGRIPQAGLKFGQYLDLVLMQKFL